MKSKNWIGLYLCTAVVVLTMIFCVMQTTPAYAWETWPAASTDDANHSWTVVFDKAMNLSTINSQNIYVSNDAEGSTRISGVSVSASDSNHALVSPPAGGWSSASKHYLIITQNVLTSEGMPLKDTVRMPFSFIQGPCKEAQTIDVINDGSQITVNVNGSQLYFDQQPYISNGHTMVPFRKIAEALGATVDWDSAKKKITIIGDKVVELTINSSVAKVNGVKVTLEAPAVITGGRTMVPLRFVGEALGAKVNYTSTQEKPSQPVEYGNTGGNISNKGLACQKGDWVYYSNDKDGWKLYRIKTDSSGRQKLNDDETWCINVAGNWVYYSNHSDHYTLYRIKTDGTGRQKLNNDQSEYINIAGSWVYYNNYSYGRTLYRIKIDGSQASGLNGDDSGLINVANGWVYYINYSTNGNLFSSNGRLYRVKTDGSGCRKLSSDRCSYINVIDNWIYYSNESDGRKLYRIKTDGSGRQKLNDDYVSDINVAGNWVYYSSGSDNGRLYRMKTDGTGQQKLSDDSCSYINVAGGWVYYQNQSDSRKFYRIKTDGSEREPVQ